MRLLVPLLSPLRRLLVLAAAFFAAAAVAAPVALTDRSPPESLGPRADYLQESGRALSLDEARAAFAAGRFQPAAAPIPNFGMGARPTWLRIAARNDGAAETKRRLAIENPWLDEVEIAFVAAGRVAASYRLGDARPHAERPVPGRLFAVDHRFAPGETEIWLRVATPDPMVLPMFLLTDEQADARGRTQDYTYGFLYGYLFALLAYNAVLFAGIRDRRYLQYALFLAAFIAMNAAYTGHGFALLWPGSPAIQRWIIPVLMVAFGCCGLTFARTFLDTPRTLPRTNRALHWATGGFLAALAAALVLGRDQLAPLLVAFVFAIYFSGAMLGLGVHAWRTRVQSSGYFLLASIASMAGTAITALAVWGWIGFADWRYRAVEAGMLVDATLLALALASRFRFLESERARADFARTELAQANAKLNESLRLVERLAESDPLTGLWNRLHLETVATTEMARAMRYRHATALLLFDIDHFKRINDTYGHHAGDEVLIELSRITRENVREADVVTRWGGEEFLVLMPNTSLEDATRAAGKLRETVEQQVFPRVPHMTISVGVAEWRMDQESLETWIARADKALYRAKAEGRNRVEVAAAEAAPA